MAVRAIRGATQLEIDDAEHLLERTRELLNELVTLNGLELDDFISVIFTATGDLVSAFPAVAARQMGFTEVPLLCTRELDIAGSLPLTVRVMAHVETEKPRDAVKHVYLHGAAVLRPDIANRVTGND